MTRSPCLTTASVFLALIIAAIRVALARVHSAVVVCVVLIAGAAVGPEARAVTWTWDGGAGTGNSNWDATIACGFLGLGRCHANWAGDPDIGNIPNLPGAADTVVFGTGFGSGAPNLNGNRTVKAVEINTSFSVRIMVGSTLTNVSGDITRKASSEGFQEISSAMILQNTPVWNIAGGGALTLFGQVSGNPFIKTGPGTVRLAGGSHNTITGTTIINDGFVDVIKPNGFNAVGGHIQVGNGIGASLSAGLITFGNDNLPDSSTVTLKSDGSWSLKNETVNVIQGSGSLNLLGNLSVGAFNGSGTFSGKIGNIGSLTKIGNGTLALSGSDPNLHTGLTKVAQGTLRLSKAGGVNAMNGDVQVGNGFGGAGTAHLQQTTNENIPNTADINIRSDGFWTVKNETVRGISGVGTIHLVGELALGGDTGFSTTFSGEIQGGSFGKLTKIGSGVQALAGSNPNVYLGLTKVSDGNLQVKKTSGVNAMGGNVQVGDGIGAANSAKLSHFNSNNIPDSSDVNVLNDGLWEPMIETVGAINGNGRITFPLGDLTVGGFNHSGTFSGFLGGDSFNKIGTGNQTLEGGAPNNISGPTVVAGGTLTLSKNENVDAVSDEVIIHSGGTLKQTKPENIPDNAFVALRGSARWEVFTETIEELEGSFSARIVIENNLTVSRSVDAFPSTGVPIGIESTLQGPGSFTKTGTGFLTLSGRTNTFTGLTTVEDGTLTMRMDPGHEAMGGDVQVGDGVGSPRSATLTHSGNHFIPDDAMVSVLSDGRWFTGDDIVGGISGSGEINLGNLTVGAANGTSTFSGALTGNGNLTKIGLGMFTLSGNNSGFTGDIVIEAGTLAVGANDSLSSQTVVDVQSGGTLHAIEDETMGGLKGAGSLVLDAMLQVNHGGQTTEFSGAISGANKLLKSGGGTLTLSGNNSYTGGTFLDGGILSVATNSSLGGATGLLVFDGGALQTTADISDMNRMTALRVGGGTFDVAGSSTLTQAGLIRDSTLSVGSLTKTGTGTLVLSGDNTYTGGTTINTGTLITANTTGSATGTGGVTINSGGTLGGTGSAAGMTTVKAGGTLAPGTSVGALGLDDAIFESNSTYAVELAANGGVAGTDFDQIAVTDNVSLEGELNITLLGGFVPDYFDEFEILVAGSRSGKFDDINGALIDGDMTLAPVYDYEGNTGVTLVAAIPGDANLDGIVNGQDLLRWQANLFSGDEWVQGDFNLDGLVSGLDLLIWQSHLFNSVQSLGGGAVAAAASVPEPGATLLLVFGGSLLAGSRRRVAR